ncbi:Ig-like domain-containing protein [Candidatus Peribacteria bacterium]|nr:Ig-like domain-containing protein [Candidatus Peribacteria bacterium]
MRFLYSLLLSILSVGLAPLMAAASVWMQISDTSAGQDAPVRITGLTSEEAITLAITKPNSTRVPITLTADAWGEVQSSIYATHVTAAGRYRADVLRGSGQDVSTSFSVAPGLPSAYQSTVTVGEGSTVADGQTAAVLTLQLVDAYKNPMSNTPFTVHSSRAADAVQSPRSTDSRGQAIITLTSTESGVSILTITAEDITLQTRPQVVFTPSPFLQSAPEADITASRSARGLGSFLQAQLFNDTQDLLEATVAYFTVVGLPDSVQQNVNQTLTVEARDADGNVLPDYRGTVRFSSSDDSAVLPTDYTFTPADQGKHSFALAVRFLTPGSQFLSVYDLSDIRINGEWNGVVIGEDAGAPMTGTPFVTIKTPRAGTYNNQRLTISGEALCASGAVDVLDNTETIFENVSIELNGTYVQQTPTLGDGAHTFVVQCAGDAAVQSDPVQVQIDRSPPQALNVEVLPSTTLDPSTEFTVNVKASEPLSSVTVTFEGVIKEFSPSGEVFTGTFIGPSACGDYPIDVQAADTLGNSVDQKAAATITICGESASEEAPYDLREDLLFADSDGDGAIDLLEMYDSDGDGVPDWAESNTADEDGDGIPDVMDTDNDTDGDGIPNELDGLPVRANYWDGNTNGLPDVLENQTDDLDGDGILNTEEMMDTDDDGVLDALESNTVDSNGNGTPDNQDPETTRPVIYDAYGVAALLVEGAFSPANITTRDTDGDGIPDSDEQGTDTDDDGDKVPNMFESALTPCAVGTTDKQHDPMCPNPPSDDPLAGNAPTAPSNLQAFPEDMAVSLLWTPSISLSDIEAYIVQYCSTGDAPVCKEQLTPDNRTKWLVEPLTACEDYTFRVTAIDSEGLKGEPSNAVTAGPNCSDSSPIPVTENVSTGAVGRMLPIFIALVCGGLVFYYGRRRG